MRFLPLVLLAACAAEPLGNQAPTINSTNIPSGRTVTVDGDGTLFFVVAEDPEGEELTFTWTLDDGSVVQGEPIPQGSQVELDPAPELEGQSLTCVVSDGESDVEVSWPLTLG